MPDLEYAKAAVLNSLTSPDAQRGYRHAINEFFDWYCSEPRLALNRTVRFKGMRDRAVLALLLACGLRKHEAVALTLDHFQWREEHCVIVDFVGKAGHVRRVPVPDWVRGELDKWIAAAAIHQGKLFRKEDPMPGSKRAKTAYNKKELSPEQREELLRALKARFENNMNRHKGLEWDKVQAKLEANAENLWSLNEMERTGGEPDVVGHDKKTGEYIFYDCSAESPKGRRSICYDREALESRKEHKPDDNAIDMAAAMGIELLTEEQYRELQKLGNFDAKTSSWVKTPSDIRKLGGALFCDRRYDTVFVYHNGAESYYAARAFRGSLTV